MQFTLDSFPYFNSILWLNLSLPLLTSMGLYLWQKSRRPLSGQSDLLSQGDFYSFCDLGFWVAFWWEPEPSVKDTVIGDSCSLGWRRDREETAGADLASQEHARGPLSLDTWFLSIIWAKSQKTLAWLWEGFLGSVKHNVFGWPGSSDERSEGNMNLFWTYSMG